MQIGVFDLHRDCRMTIDNIGHFDLTLPEYVMEVSGADLIHMQSMSIFSILSQKRFE